MDKICVDQSNGQMCAHVTTIFEQYIFSAKLDFYLLFLLVLFLLLIYLFIYLFFISGD